MTVGKRPHRQIIRTVVMTAFVRHCWVLASDFRKSCVRYGWTTEPTVRAVVLENINVSEEHRRQGHCRRLIEELCGDDRFDMVVVEAVQNPVLADFLARLGWDRDPCVSDFYFYRREWLKDARREREEQAGLQGDRRPGRRTGVAEQDPPDR